MRWLYMTVSSLPFQAVILHCGEDACWVFSFFYNTPNSDMDYKIFFLAYLVLWLFAVATHKGDVALTGLQII